MLCVFRGLFPGADVNEVVIPCLGPVRD
jgi:hypothetical protein